MKPLSQLAAVSILVSGCALGGVPLSPPLVCADVAFIENRHEVSRTPLSLAPLQALTLWLEQRKSKWHGMLTEATNEPRALRFSLRDASGDTGSIALVARHDGGYDLQFHSDSQKWSYRSFGGLFGSWAANQSLSTQDLNQLRRAVGLP